MEHALAMTIVEYSAKQADASDKPADTPAAHALKLFLVRNATEELATSSAFKKRAFLALDGLASFRIS